MELIRVFESGAVINGEIHVGGEPVTPIRTEVYKEGNTFKITDTYNLTGGMDGGQLIGNQTLSRNITIDDEAEKTKFMEFLNS